MPEQMRAEIVAPVENMVTKWTGYRRWRERVQGYALRHECVCVRFGSFVALQQLGPIEASLARGTKERLLRFPCYRHVIDRNGRGAGAEG